MTTAVFPGSFDPFHLGHLAVVEWAAAAHDDVVIGILGNPEKRTGMFAPDVRLRLISLATAHLDNVRCVAFDGLTGDLARQSGASVIVRSAHKEADLERSLAVFNKFMSGGTPTEFAPPDPATEHISSTRLRRLLLTGETDAAVAMVPEAIRSELRQAERLPSTPEPPAGTSAPGPMTVGRRVRVVRVAAVQDSPVLLDRDASVDRALDLIQAAASQSAELVVFPEAFLPGYPDWVWRTQPGDGPAGAKYRTLFDNAVVIGSAFTQILGAAAHRYGLYVSIGINEREATGSTLYSTQLLLGPDRAVLSAHRKLVPTGAERLVWGMGHGSGLRVVETPFGRIGTLLSEESYMPLARAALYARGVDIYLAPAWRVTDVWPATLRHIAREGGVYVVGVTPHLTAAQRPQELRARHHVCSQEDGAPAEGHSMIVGPTGRILAGPLIGQTGILTVELDVNDARIQRQQFDPTGYHSRPDLLTLQMRLDDQT
jgi:nitrilase